MRQHGLSSRSSRYNILLQSAYLLVETSNLLKQKAGQLADLLR